MSNLIQKIKEILSNVKLDNADKLIDINNLVGNVKEVETAELFGQIGEVKRFGNTIIFDGSYGCNYVDNPHLKNQDDIYYQGAGTTWGIDLDGNRYWKRYSSFVTKGAYPHLSHGDIINEKARIKKIVMECLSELNQ